MRKKKGLEPTPSPGADAWTLAARAELQILPAKVLARWTQKGTRVEIRQGATSLWTIVRWPHGVAVALRSGYWPGGIRRVRHAGQGADHRFHLIDDDGELKVHVWMPDPQHWLLRLTVEMIASEDLTIPYWPRDLYPLDRRLDPLKTRGAVHAAQRDNAAGVVYYTQLRPKPGLVFYFQNFTALNDYLRTTRSVPNTAVTGDWPQLGFSLPGSSGHAMPKNRWFTICDAFLLSYSLQCPPAKVEMIDLAQGFLDGLGEVYPYLEKPPTRYRDWLAKADQSLHDLEHCPDLCVHEKGKLYLRPYVGAGPPDSMVQLSVLPPMQEYAGLRDEPIPLIGKLEAGIHGFYDRKIGSIVRYLPGVGDEHHPWRSDSWYLYHPLMSLARLIRDGASVERELLESSLKYGIKVAHHFRYRWPINFDLYTLKPVESERKPGEPGESDTGGLYAYTMLLARDLFDDDRYLQEATRALDALGALRFNIGYQFNNVAWGATACLRAWRQTGRDKYLHQATIFLASFFHNSFFYESQLGPAAHYPTFLGVRCLHDAPYMAMFEEHESFQAFAECLRLGNDGLPASIRLLLAEYWRLVLDRGWFYYPAALPRKVLAPEVKEGRIDQKLAIPLEDLYADWSPPGHVGQEVYGAGAAFAFAAMAYHRVADTPMLVYCSYPVLDWEASAGKVRFRTSGDPVGECEVRLLHRTNGLARPSRAKVDVRVQPRDGTRWERAAPVPREKAAFRVPGDTQVVVSF